jgi:hypothetical protein
MKVIDIKDGLNETMAGLMLTKSIYRIPGNRVKSLGILCFIEILFKYIA